ncbi:hypothetical protein SSBR45G_03560 [Bradyrhizobium sp. SSBR45G]|uniref:DUF2336 domain-containing protein n=1 Tax=unclassified Bradyrhizobium TaxID=2631580 RepID=UPI002342B3AC|nr:MULTISPECIES: DUF2336 domain-containing protein [unclassified Bradyrhizobium]GLH75448.1 hypothetical protein SSBR45G_03560 [Bradyrhizobium sp. SSBR45G]GLH82765.1 hypothetical protein SSBR45R_02250 [Bradyrhizobium sp. SSBR45R]
MSNPQFTIAEDVQAAIATGSAERCSGVAERVASLFIASAGNLDAEQHALFADVFERLVNTIELRALADVGARIALAELSAQLAPIPQTPVAVIRRLAHHDDIAVAGPVLSESPRLSAEDLVEIAGSRSEKHLIAVAGRWWLQEIVTDALLVRRYPSVSRKLMKNPGARISAAGFSIILAQAMGDPELAIATGIRADLPAALRRTLLQSASEAVRARLLASAPPHLYEEIRGAIAAVTADAERGMSRSRDFGGAKLTVGQLKQAGKLNEAMLLDFARQRRYTETIAAIAELAKCSIELVRPLMQSLRSDGILVPCKTAGLSWTTVAAILDSRFVSGATKPDELTKLKNRYLELTLDEAQRLLKLWSVRTGSSAN